MISWTVAPRLMGLVRLSSTNDSQRHIIRVCISISCRPENFPFTNGTLAHSIYFHCILADLSACVTLWKLSTLSFGASSNYSANQMASSLWYLLLRRSDSWFEEQNQICPQITSSHKQWCNCWLKWGSMSTRQKSLEWHRAGKGWP